MMQVKTKSCRQPSFTIKTSGLSLSLALGAGLSLALQFGPQVAQADSRPGDGFVITHDAGAERKALQRAQKEQAKAFKQHQHLESNYILDKRTRHKIQKQEKQNLKAQQKLQKQWLRQHQWSQQH